MNSSNTKELLNFISSLRERLINKAHANGVTTWALGVAVLYLLVQALPSIAKLKFFILSPSTFIVFFAHSFGFLIGLRWLHSSLKGESKFSKFDYRFLMRHPKEIASLVLGVVAVEGVYFTCLVIGLQVSNELESYEILLFKLNAIFFGGLIVALFCFAVKYIYDYSEQSTNPTGLSLRTPTKNAWKVDGVLITLLLPNGIYLIFPTSILSIEQYQEFMGLSFQLGLVLCCVSYYLNNFNNSNTLQLLNKLERDIVLHGLPEDEIKRRLQEEYFGSEFHSWVAERFKELNQHELSLREKLASFDAFEAEINSIDVALVYERRGRLESFKGDLKERFDLVNTCREKLMQCLKNCLRFTASDEYLKSFINEKIDDCDKLVERVNLEFNTANSKLDKLV